MAAAIEHADVPFAHEYRTVIDVGAGRGQFALFAATQFPHARILSFEPLPDSYELARSVLEREPAVEVRRLAIGDAAGVVAMNVTRDRDSSSLRAVAAEQSRRFPGTDLTDRIEVRVERLDRVVSSGELTAPVLLKIDVQGSELEVLEGAEDLLPVVHTVFAECSFVELYEGQALFDEVEAHLGDRGFEIAGIHAPIYGDDGVRVQADVLFERM